MSSALATARGRRRSDARPARRHVSALEYGRERFRFSLIRDQRRLSNLNIDPFVQGCDWHRAGAIRTGELNFQRPLTGMQAAAIAKGDRVGCDVDLRGNGQWKSLWQMVVNAPDHDVIGGVISLALRAELKALQEDKVTFSFRDADARRMTLAIARRFHVKVGRLPAAKHKIDRYHRKSASPLDAITWAWNEERKATGRRFDVDVSRGLLDVNELHEPETVLVIEGAITDATIRETVRLLASAVVVTSTRKEDGRTKKIQVRVVDERRRRRHGYIVRHVNKPGLHSEAAAREYGKQQLARVLKPSAMITISHPGLPFLDRGAPVRLRVPPAGLDALMFVASSDHSLSAGSYTMDLTLAYSNPWVDARKERAKKKREAAARRRGRPGSSTTKAAQPRKASRRSGS